MVKIMTKNKTTLTRVYRDDLMEFKIKYPKVESADFFHIVLKSNPFIRVESYLRKPKRKNDNE